MKKLSVVVLIFSGFALAGPKPENDGYWWAGLSPQYKTGYVWGYLGMQQANIGKTTQCVMFAKDLQQAKFPNVSLQDVLQKFCFDSTEADDFDGIAVGQFIDGVADFYKDYRNKQLPIDWALQYVRDGIKGKTGSELASELETWRKCETALRSGDSEKTVAACK